jgi:hypothetical protein
MTSKAKSKKILVARIVTAIISFPYAAWVASLMWGWFVVPLGVSQIGMWHAGGLVLFMTWPSASAAVALVDLGRKEDEIDDLAKSLGALFVPTIMLALGYAYRLFM